jgi:ubiquinone/menaquinone biosynthesis C-methylase UbiE
MAILDDSVDSYAWWQEHGNSWPVEIETRRKTQIIYTLQECFLQTYLGMLAPAKILEFGCGFGRHLSYLINIPELDCYGCDQSSTMLEGLSRWAPEAWMSDRIKLVEPLAKLPYADKTFDAVFTSSVLIHVAPAHVLGILRELTRVTRHEIIHVENNSVEHTKLSSPEHDGCWMHPLVDLYREIGAVAQVLDKGLVKQDIYRVRLEPFMRRTDAAERLLGKLGEIDRRWTAIA